MMHISEAVTGTSSQFCIMICMDSGGSKRKADAWRMNNSDFLLAEKYSSAGLGRGIPASGAMDGERKGSMGEMPVLLRIFKV